MLGGLQAAVMQRKNRIGPRVAVTAAQPAVGPQVVPVSFTDQATVTPEANARRRQAAEMLMAQAQQPRAIRHPMQGAAQMTQAAMAGLDMAVADRREASDRRRAAEALVGHYGSGSDDPLAGLAFVDPNTYAQIMQHQRAVEAAQAQRTQARQWQVEDRQANFANQKALIDHRAEAGAYAPDQTNINLGDREKAFEKNRGDTFANRAGSVEKSGFEAYGKMQQYRTMENILDRLETGRLTPAMQTIGGIAKAVGVDPSVIGIDSDLPASAEAFNALASQMVTAAIGGEDGFPASNFSDADRRFVTRQFPQLMSTTEGNRIILQTLQAVENMKMDRAASWQQARDGALQSGTNEEEAFRQWEVQWNQHMRSNDYFAGIAPGDDASEPDNAGSDGGVRVIPFEEYFR